MKALLSTSFTRLVRPFESPGVFIHMSRSRKWRTKNIEGRKQARAAATTAKMEESLDYKTWSHESLIERVTQLEAELKVKNSSVVPTVKKYSKKVRGERQFDASKYSTRLIALKLSYLGKNYNGFEHHANNWTPLPTIEEELWKALNKAKLIFPKGINPLEPGKANWDGCDYSKCGRTDKGVSAFGQVIGIRVRSNRPLGKRREGTSTDGEVQQDVRNSLPRKMGIETASPPLSPSRRRVEDGTEFTFEDEDYGDALDFDPVADEIPYPIILNRLLPPEIRILAWCPAPPLDFSARFSCRERQYKYFFTQPAFTPMPHHIDVDATPNSMQDGWLNIEAMREAAKHFEGLHDFRNFCKVDPSKQLSNFQRRVYHVGIDEVDSNTSVPGFVNGPDFLPVSGTAADYPKVYTFTLHGSAFLWHQVRHMVAVLFLVGQGLEDPSIVSKLLDIENYPCRPMYEMASDTPLVLWNCIFPLEGDEERKDALKWNYIGDERGLGDTKYGSAGLMEDLWKTWRERKIDEILAGSLLDVAFKQGIDVKDVTSNVRKGMPSQKVYDGSNVPRLQGTYIPLLKKQTLETVDVINAKYALRRGFESSEEMKKQGYRRLPILPGQPGPPGPPEMKDM